jgi:hypothetical protein
LLESPPRDWRVGPALIPLRDVHLILGLTIPLGNRLYREGNYPVEVIDYGRRSRFVHRCVLADYFAGVAA